MNEKVKSAVLGYPRIGSNRELKKNVEAYWQGEVSESVLKGKAKELRKANWLLQKELGIDIIPSNDFSLYDHMLDMSALLGVIPERFKWKGKELDLDTYFSMARGINSVSAMEMTKWFDTNYHYIAPEFIKGQIFKITSSKVFVEFQEALAIGIKTRPVIVGPITYLMLGKVKENFSVFNLLDPLLGIYIEVFKELMSLGVEWVQIDEPVLVLDLPDDAVVAFKRAYERFNQEVPQLNTMLTTYFGPLKENLKLVSSLPVKGLHLDLVRAPEELNNVLNIIPKEVFLSLGVVDGRNIWRTDLEKVLRILEPATIKRENLIIAPSCSLLHVPIDLELEDEIDVELKSWLAFAKQKLDELVIIQKAINDGITSVEKKLKENQYSIQNRTRSNRIHIKAVKERMSKISINDYSRKSEFKVRQKIQKSKLNLPLFPTTTIGSFPQTKDLRKARADLRRHKLNTDSYNRFIKEKIKEAIDKQIEIGLDVLVHGEAERNDMVEYFGELLQGFAFTKNGWVQSYGSRSVKPPIIYGDVMRSKPMTIEWIKYAKSLTKKPVKGILTGPITILQWSFIRDDQPRSETAKQIALAIRDEVTDLEASGINIIQIDEPAIREGLPLRMRGRAEYLQWAVQCFKLASCGVRNETQIHTHMCYSEFNDIIDSIAAMDADVISIETSRSQMDLLDVFYKFKYPNEIGPGVFDVHSPAIPSKEEIELLLKKATKVIPPENIWVNPDCGLKTRAWEETTQSLKNMVNAAKSMRELYVHEFRS